MAFGKFGRYHPDGADVHATRFDLVRTLREEVTALAAGAGAGHQLRFESDIETCTVETDLEHVRYVVVNLLQNAVKYSEPGTVVALSLGVGEGEARLCVRDEGIGIPAEDVAALFSPFYRASNVAARPGTGMGLAIAKKSASLLGGTIAVRTAAGQGTTFTVILPLRANRR